MSEPHLAHIARIVVQTSIDASLIEFLRAPSTHKYCLYAVPRVPNQCQQPESHNTIVLHR
jgi:hypothetical protein